MHHQSKLSCESQPNIRTVGCLLAPSLVQSARLRHSCLQRLGSDLGPDRRRDGDCRRRPAGQDNEDHLHGRRDVQEDARPRRGWWCAVRPRGPPVSGFDLIGIPGNRQRRHSAAWNQARGSWAGNGVPAAGRHAYHDNCHGSSYADLGEGLFLSDRPRFCGLFYTSFPLSTDAAVGAISAAVRCLPAPVWLRLSAHQGPYRRRRRSAP